MTKNIGDGRPVRVCDLCGGVDDHPRHVIAGNLLGVFTPSNEALSNVMTVAPDDRRGELVRALLDTTSSDRHLDCCREAGCPDGSCGLVTEGAADLRGKDLLAHLTDNADDINERVTSEYQRRYDLAVQNELLRGN